MHYRFDEFELDADRYELRQRGTVQHVEPLVFDLIRFLTANPGRVVTRDEIIDAVWQGRVVSDATVASCVKSARRALGDSGDSQSYIRTVRGRGFEFTGRVTTSATSPAASCGACGDGTEAVACAPVGVTPIQTRRLPSATGEAGPKPVLAVLPLANLSAEVDEYFADGLTEDIITNLARFRDLSVIGGGTTLQFKARALDLEEIRARLKAAYVVQGSVRRAAGRVRISVQLVDGVTGVQLWGERYDRDMVDLFELQDDVTRTIAATLGVKVQGVALQRALTKKPHELDAYDCVLRARRYTWLLNSEAHSEARDLLERAVELDPLSSDAHALLANVYLGEHRFDMNRRPHPISRAMVHALAAVQLDPQNAYARCWLAIVHFFRKENDKFEAEAELALGLNPNDPETLADIGHFYAFMGRFERGVELSRRAQQLNPLHPGWYWFSFARQHYHQKDYARVIGDMQRTGLGHFPWAHMLRAAAKGQLGHADGGAALARMREVRPDFHPRRELEKWNAEPADLEHIMDGLRRAGHTD